MRSQNSGRSAKPRANTSATRAASPVAVSPEPKPTPPGTTSPSPPTGTTPRPRTATPRRGVGRIRRGPAWAPRPGGARHPGGEWGYRAVASLPMVRYAQAGTPSAPSAADGGGEDAAELDRYPVGPRVQFGGNVERELQ